MNSNIDVVFICKGRKLLTIQSLLSMYQNTGIEFNLFVVDGDHYGFPPDNLTKQLTEFYGGHYYSGYDTVEHEVVSWFAPQCRLFGAEQGTAQYIYFADNDTYFAPHWLETLIDSWTIDKPADIKLLGGGCHKYMQDNRVVGKYHYKDAIPTWSWFMERETWDKYKEGMGSTTPTGQSEDWMFCQRIIKDGFAVASVWPEVVFHTGITQWNEETLTAGHETLEVPKGVVCK